jgi:hypothetical protein
VIEPEPSRLRPWLAALAALTILWLGWVIAGRPLPPSAIAALLARTGTATATATAGAAESPAAEPSTAPTGAATQELPVTVVRAAEDSRLPLPPSWRAGTRVTVGFVEASDLPGDRWETFVVTSSPWAARQASSWGEQAILGTHMKVIQMIIDLPPGTDPGRVKSSWRAFLAEDGATPGPLRAQGLSYLGYVMQLPTTTMERRTIESARALPARYPDSEGAGWSFAVTTSPNRGSMTMDAFEWQSGRLATLLVVMQTPDAPPFDMSELLRRARASLNDAQKVN